MRHPPRIPASWYTPKGAIIGATLAVGVTWLMADVGGALGVVLATPVIAGAATLPIVVFFEWAFGRGQRAYRFGKGKQDVWGYQGHNIRGLVEEGQTWVSVADCETASGLNLSSGLKAIPTARRRMDETKGLMLDMPSMIKVLDACGEDIFKVSRFRLFLERSVWKVRRG